MQLMVLIGGGDRRVGRFLIEGTQSVGDVAVSPGLAFSIGVWNLYACLAGQCRMQLLASTSWGGDPEGSVGR